MAYRSRNTVASVKIHDDVKSTVSKQSTHVSHRSSKSTASLITPEVAVELKAMNSGKPVGMSEKEWNEIVQKNYSNYINEQKTRKDKLTTQREQMKTELLK
jgi:hypothetical protein